MKIEFEFHSVDDKMPIPSSYVLVFVPALEEFSVEYIYKSRDGDPVFSSGWNKGQAYEVTHWAYIPYGLDKELMKIKK